MRCQTSVFLADKRMDGVGEFERELQDVREYFQSGETRSIEWRKTQLKGVLKLLKEKEGDIFEALYQDLGKNQVEAFRDEVGILLKSTKYALEQLQKWMKPKKIQLPRVAFPTTAKMVSEPFGLVLIFSSWNFPIGLSLEPMIGAIAAGNALVLKPSELAPASSSLLASLIPMYLDNKAIKVVEGGVSIAEGLLEKKWDKIFFTGSPRVGRIVMFAAAKHLTPITLELGGKCPAVVDSLETSRDWKVSLKRILGGKYGSCCGQACIAIDYILVEKNFAPILVDSLKLGIKKMFGENPGKTNSISRVVNKQQFLRLKKLLNNAAVKASIVYGGSLDEDKLFIEPTILLDPPLEADIMNEEIFGPILPIITLENIKESVDFINSRPKPLALYVFTNNKALKKTMISETSSGCLMFNDTMIQYLVETIPFGGVGESGFGRYHGKFSFEEFRHEKPVVKRGFFPEIWFRYPPWNGKKLKLLRTGLVYNYFGFVLAFLRRKKSYEESESVLAHNTDPYFHLC